MEKSSSLLNFLESKYKSDYYSLEAIFFLSVNNKWQNSSTNKFNTPATDHVLRYRLSSSACN